MQRIYQNIFLIIALFFSTQALKAQSITGNDTIPTSVDPALQSIFEGKYPKEYTIAGITVTGFKAFDQNLIVSISGLAVGDKVLIPGTDAFGKAIAKLWKQNLVSDVAINITKLEGNNIYLEMAITERPRLLDFKFVGIKKAERDDLATKIGFSKDRVLTEEAKLSAVEIIRKFYNGKGFRNVKIDMKESVANNNNNAINITFYIDKGNKVKINSVNFSENYSQSDKKLKKQMKGTKEMTKITLFPEEVKSVYGEDSVKEQRFKDYLKETGYLYPSKTKDYLEPYFRLKFFSSSKFNETKYAEDKDRILNYYNSKGFRDARIVADTQVINPDGNLDVHLRVSEGKKYYFGDITWKGNTKYSDSILNYILAIKKGDIYNIETLNKRLGKQLSPEGGDIGSLYMDDGYLFFRVEPIETAVYNDTIDYEIRMTEGPQAVYGNITVSGNDKTKDYVVLRELRTIPGEKFSRQDIIRTQRELSQLGFFNPETINPNVVPNADNGTVDINWQVEEKSADQLELSAGFGGGIGLTGTLGVTFNNFSLKNITKNQAGILCHQAMVKN